MEELSLAIMTFSGFERPNTPAKASERVERLLDSIFNSGDSLEGVKILVSDDGSDNAEGQLAVFKVCKKFGVDHALASKWLGVSGNYNFACSLLNTKWIALLSDDQIVSSHFLKPILYFLKNNDNSKLGMLGWSVIFADELIKFGYLTFREDFYSSNHWQEKVSLSLLSSMGKESHSLESDFLKWGCSSKPYIRGHCSGSAFLVRRELWKLKGGFFESIFQPDEDYGDWVWNSTNSLCVQVPTPPIYHYGGGSSFGPHCEDDLYKNCHLNWEKRPDGVGEGFRNRGMRAVAKIAQLKTKPEFNYLRAEEWSR